jgi:hypothetical protein
MAPPKAVWDHAVLDLNTSDSEDSHLGPRKHVASQKAKSNQEEPVKPPPKLVKLTKKKTTARAASIPPADLDNNVPFTHKAPKALKLPIDTSGFTFRLATDCVVPCTSVDQDTHDLELKEFDYRTFTTSMAPKMAACAHKSRCTTE